MTAEEKRILYWAGMLNEAFPEESSSLISEGDHWPEDFVRRAVNRIKKSPIGKTAWFDENSARLDARKLAAAYEMAGMTHTSKETNLFKTIIGWLIEYAGVSEEKYRDFIDEKFESVVQNLKFFVGSSESFSEYYGIFRNGMSFSEFQIASAKAEEEKEKIENRKMKNFVASDKGYELLKIDSYGQFHEMFGDEKTGGGEGPEKGWCHANEDVVYDTWTKNSKNVFFVLFRKDWRVVEPRFESFDDEYGRSAIAFLVGGTTGKLLNATFRYNHVVIPGNEKVDNAVSGYSDLSEIAGFDVEKRVKELIDWNEEAAKNHNPFIDEWADGLGGIDCSREQLDSLKGAPRSVAGCFNCSKNDLSSLEFAPLSVAGNFDCSDNKLANLNGCPEKIGFNLYCAFNSLTSLEGCPEEIKEDAHCSYNRLTNLGGGPRFVREDFFCNNNRLTSLADAPEKVGGAFVCSHNRLTSLKGGPAMVVGMFDCENNELTSLEGAPSEIKFNFYCDENKLISLKGAPRRVAGTFTCDHNNLSNLEGAPETVGGDFHCSYNHLTSLAGCPREIGGYFSCKINNLTSLEGGPAVVLGNFDCSNNGLKTLKGAPSRVEGDFFAGYGLGRARHFNRKLSAYLEYLKNPVPELTDERGCYRPKEED